jgi:hypothetical protein
MVSRSIFLAYIGFQQHGWPRFNNPTFPTTQSPQNFSPAIGFQGGVALQQMLGQLMQAFTMMAQGWQGMLGGQAGGNPYGNPASAPPGFYGPGPSGNVHNFGGPNQGGRGLASPTDPQDFASYLQAQRLGGSLQGKTGLAQRDAIPGTRFGRLQDPHLWDVGVARNYAFQFAAYASDNDALSPQGVQAGAQAFQNMAPDAKLFMQVASVFKGDINGGPGFYDNPGLQRLLESKGQFDLIKPGVGETDVQTIGAVTKAINRGVLSLNDIVNSGTIDNMDRYQQIIQYVQNGGFGQDVGRYDSTPF